MRLVVGLGNPGERYRNTRHNVGFMVVDAWVDKKGLAWGKAANALYAENRQLGLLKPLTYMNLSGEALRPALNLHKWEEVLIIVDDINLPLGQLRLRSKGSDGGHNGLKSIIACLGNSDFERLRLGVGAPVKQGLAQFVLDTFSPEDSDTVNIAVQTACELLDVFAARGYQAMVTQYSKLNNRLSRDDVPGSPTEGGNPTCLPTTKA